LRPRRACFVGHGGKGLIERRQVRSSDDTRCTKAGSNAALLRRADARVVKRDAAVMASSMPKLTHLNGGRSGFLTKV
jgi:hypothetical protein